MAGQILRALVLAHKQPRISEAVLKVVATFEYLEVGAAGSDKWVRDSGPKGAKEAPTQVQVFAARAFKQGELVLVPLPRTSASISANAVSDKAIATAHMDEKSNPYKIVPTTSWGSSSVAAPFQWDSALARPQGPGNPALRGCWGHLGGA